MRRMSLIKASPSNGVAHVLSAFSCSQEGRNCLRNVAWSSANVSSFLSVDPEDLRGLKTLQNQCLRTVLAQGDLVGIQVVVQREQSFVPGSLAKVRLIADFLLCRILSTQIQHFAGSCKISFTQCIHIYFFLLPPVSLYVGITFFRSKALYSISPCFFVRCCFPLGKSKHSDEMKLTKTQRK